MSTSDDIPVWRVAYLKLWIRDSQGVLMKIHEHKSDNICFKRRIRAWILDNVIMSFMGTFSPQIFRRGLRVFYRNQGDITTHIDPHSCEVVVGINLHIFWEIH